MIAKLEKGELSLLISLVTLEIGKEIGGDGSVSNYGQRLTAMRDKLLTMLVEKKESSNGNPPEFCDYTRRKYQEELSETIITMLEDLVEMRKQKFR